MGRNDQQAIEGLFSKLAHVERQAGPRDTDAERFIHDRVSQQPGAPYFMAQTIVVQEQALEAAQRRIEELEYQTANSQPQRGGLLSGLFGGGSQQQPRSQRAFPPSPWGQQGGHAIPGQGRAGGGFLAGAAQTAMGVAGGVLLGNAIMGMMGGDEAQAAETTAADEPAANEGSIEDDFEM